MGNYTINTYEMKREIIFFEGENKENYASVLKVQITAQKYFKFKKQEYNFEDFRVRTLKSINTFTYFTNLIVFLKIIL